MNCSNCNNLFNTTNHIPRLLPSCGHSFCEPCLQSMITQPSSSSNPIINCLMCHVITTLEQTLNIARLPKNLALIDSITNLNAFITSTTSKLNSNPKKKCSIHNKDLEVYCENDSKLLCVNCLLEKSHLNHQLCPIEEAIKIEKDKIDNVRNVLIEKANIFKELIVEIEQKTTIQRENNDELIKHANALYDDIIERITAKRNALIVNINNYKETSSQYFINKKDQLLNYIKVIESIKARDDYDKHNNEIDCLVHLKEINGCINAILNMSETDFSVKNNSNNTLIKHKEIEEIKNELDDYKKNLVEVFGSDKEKDEEGNQSNGKISTFNTNQDILITQASNSNNEANSLETNALPCIRNHNNKPIVIEITDINKVINSTFNEGNNSGTLYITTKNNKDNGTKQIDGKQTEYININNQSTFKFTKGSTMKPSPQKKLIHKTLFPSFKSSSSNQLNKIGTFNNISSFINSNYSDNDSLNCSNSQCIQIDNQLNNNIGTKAQAHSNDNINNLDTKSPNDNLDKTKIKSQTLFNVSLNKELSINNPISPFLRNYLLENNYESGCGMNYTSSVISNNNQQEMSALYKETTISYIFIGGKSDMITRQWCIDSFQWLNISKRTSNGGQDLVVERSDFVLLKYKEKKTLIVGGKVNSNGMETLTDSIQLLNIEKKSIDKLDFKLPNPKCAFGGLYIHSQIFIAGGSDGRFTLNTFEYFDKKTKQWYELPKMFHKRKHFAMIASFDNCIFAIGGQDEKGAILRNVERYDLNKKVWIKAKEMNQSRKSSCVVCMPDGIYVIGGYDGAQYLKSVEKYDFMTRKWVYLSDMIYTKSDFCVMASIDCRYIYTFGGYNGKPLNVIEQFDILANQWKHIASMPVARYKHHVIEELNEINNRLKD